MVHFLSCNRRMSHSTPAPTDCDLENAQALAFWFSPLRCVIVWQDNPGHLQPVNRETKRLRDIQPGDEVYWRGELQTIKSVAVYR